MRLVLALLLLLLCSNAVFATDVELAVYPLGGSIGGTELWGLWHFDEATWGTIIDATYRGHDGAAGGGINNTTGGKWGKRATGNGTSQYMIMDDSNDWTPYKSSGCSFGAWVATGDVSSSVIICQYDYRNNNTEGWIFYWSSIDDLVLRIWSAHDGSRNYIGRVDNDDDSKDAVQAGGWHWLVGTWDGGATNASLKIYCNGVQIDNADAAGGTFSGTPQNVAQELIVGAYEAIDAYCFNGSLDEPFYLPRAMSAQEVLREYLRKKKVMIN